MEPRHLVRQAVDTDDQCGRYVGQLEVPAPVRDRLTVTGEHDCLGRSRRNVRRDLPATVVIERPSHELSRDWVGTRRYWLWLGCTSADARLLFHSRLPSLKDQAPQHRARLQRVACSAASPIA